MDVFDQGSRRPARNFPDWAINDCKKSSPNSFKKFIKSLVATKEILYSNLEEFKNYENSNILIIGGGPSTNTIDFSLSEYDYIWSCNHFFKHPRLKEEKIDLAMIMPEVDIKSPAFKEYRDIYNPLCGFEIHDNWLNYNFDNYEKYFFMHTKFYGKVGIGARMLIFGAALKCKKITFVGFDGPSFMKEGNHAFEPGKTTLPSICGGKTHQQVIDLYLYQYKFLWNYIHNNFPQTQFQNIGFGSEYHQYINNPLDFEGTKNVSNG